MSVHLFREKKCSGDRISVVTCYDAWTARILDRTAVDCLLVGDSAAMVVHGYDNTLAATTEMMVMHVQAVRRGAPSKFIVADMPFLTFRKGLSYAMECVEQLMRAGANAVKLEGVTGHADVIAHIVDSGIPVMGHLGLIPQSVNALGGLKVQAKDGGSAQRLVKDAVQLEEAGCFSVVLECIRENAAEEVTARLKIPTIGIGAGSAVDGQVLVLQDLLGMDPDFKPKFARPFGNGFDFIRQAVNDFVEAVEQGTFPTDKETYH